VYYIAVDEHVGQSPGVHTAVLAENDVKKNAGESVTNNRRFAV